MPTAICPVCHREYKFTNARTDHCPYCVPKDEPEDIWRDDLTQESDESYS